MKVNSLYFNSTDSISGTISEKIYRNCASDDLCPTQRLIEYSTSTGGLASYAFGLCCFDDLCNDATLPCKKKMRDLQICIENQKLLVW